MGDLMVTALQTGLTNVATFMVGPERWDTPYKYGSLFDKPRSHHQMSHNQGRFINDLLKVDHFHMQQFAYIVEKMDNIEEINGTTLLDNTLLTYGSGLGDGATHQYSALPIIMVVPVEDASLQENISTFQLSLVLSPNAKVPPTPPWLTTRKSVAYASTSARSQH